jgi:ATP-binding cassette subfamily B (MDR/TAP) protein 1
LIPNLQSFAEGSASAGYVYQIIDRKSKIDILDNSGNTPAKLIGDIEFKNVYFKYPAREDAQVSCRFTILHLFYSLFCS